MGSCFEKSLGVDRFRAIGTSRSAAKRLRSSSSTPLQLLVHPSKASSSSSTPPPSPSDTEEANDETEDESERPARKAKVLFNGNAVHKVVYGLADGAQRWLYAFTGTGTSSANLAMSDQTPQHNLPV